MQLRIAISVTSLVAFSICAAFAQSDPPPPPPYATITYSDGSSVVAPGGGGAFPLVGLQPNQVVKVDVQLALIHALQLFTIQSLDGAVVLPPEAAAAPVGPPPPMPCTGCPLPSLVEITTQSATLSFTFVAGSLPGSYRVKLWHGSHGMLLEFWAQDPDNPQINPPAITPATPDNY